MQHSLTPSSFLIPGPLLSSRLPLVYLVRPRSPVNVLSEMTTRISHVKACPRRPRRHLPPLAHVSPPESARSTSNSNTNSISSDHFSQDSKLANARQPSSKTITKDIVHKNAFVAVATKARRSVTAITTSNSVKYLIAGVCFFNLPISIRRLRKSSSLQSNKTCLS